MTTLDLIDDSLREEVSEECSKYGVVNVRKKKPS